MASNRSQYTEAKHLKAKAKWMDRYWKLRKLAIYALGGGCCKCKESNPEELYIMAANPKAVKWGQHYLYSRIVEAYKQDTSDEKLAPFDIGVLVCKKCRFYMLGIAALDRKREIIEQRKRELESPNTGEFYWIAGERVERIKLKQGGVMYKGQPTGFNYAQYEDFSLGWDDDSAI